MKQAIIPFNMSPARTNTAADFPSTLRVLVSPALLLPWLRMSLPYIFPTITAVLRLPKRYPKAKAAKIFKISIINLLPWNYSNFLLFPHQYRVHLSELCRILGDEAIRRRGFPACG